MRSIKIIQPPKSIHAKLDQSLCWCDAGVAGGQTKRGRGCIWLHVRRRRSKRRRNSCCQSQCNHFMLISSLLNHFEAIYRREFPGFKFRTRVVLTAGGTLRGRWSAARKFWNSPKSDFHKKQPCKTHGNGV